MKNLEKVFGFFIFVAIAVLSRLVVHPPNFTPIAAMALFGGVYMNKKYAIIVPAVALLISDYVLGFHATMPFVYGSFLLTGLVGLWLKKHKKLGYILVASILSSVLFFVITNFGVWATGTMYIKNVVGLVECYLVAIPFFRNTLVGDIMYTGIFFGGYELITLMARYKGNFSKLLDR